jgi:hypothetical protein
MTIDTLVPHPAGAHIEQADSRGCWTAGGHSGSGTTAVLRRHRPSTEDVRSTGRWSDLVLGAARAVPRTMLEAIGLAPAGRAPAAATSSPATALATGLRPLTYSLGGRRPSRTYDRSRSASSGADSLAVQTACADRITSAGGALQTMQQIGATLGLAVLVTVFGTAVRNAAPGGGTHAALVSGMTAAFAVSTVVAAVTLAVAAIFRRPG